ncbi:MAG: hypothetical protein HKN64_03575 [Woeseiaceae bacterium]|nr:hypothetical protein [Woeseiaceae bacterium]
MNGRMVAVVCAGCLLAGLAMGAWLFSTASVPGDESRLPAGAAKSAPAGLLEARLAGLEKALVDERNARNILEEELQVLAAEVERLDPPALRAITEAPAGQSRAERQGDRRPPRDFASMVRNYQERRRKAMVDGGFTDDEARRVLSQESRAQYQAMQAAHEATRRGETVDPSSDMTGPQALLRAELGDDDYARYLEAQGQPTAIEVTQVLEDSAGRLAGLQSGDRIVGYAGERVFHVEDLRKLTLQGNLGEDVVIDIERDGVRMQLSVPRGPVGISGSGANLRNMNWWGGG